MTGPEHYRRAEEMAAGLSVDWDYDDPEDRATVALILAEAQVHATLALAAAVAMGTGRADDHGMMAEDDSAWREVCSAVPS